MIKVTYFGSEKDIQNAISVLKGQEKLEEMSEGKARLLVQELIDTHKLRATIMINGSSVWSKDRIIANLHSVIKHGILYNEQQDKPPILSKYFYHFLSLECGSIAHYDIHGWIHRYPTVGHLKKFFLKNEFGKRVSEDIPERMTDVKAIVDVIEATLFPFQAYIQRKGS